ncbi:MAG: outer membrane protein assembly factor BamB [Mariniblastus sp.]|jgi:outer membrane protein assembly factor BamB
MSQCAFRRFRSELNCRFSGRDLRVPSIRSYFLADKMKILSLFVSLTLLALLTTSIVAQDRAFATNSRLTLGIESNRSASVRLGDLDGDGNLDAVIANGRHWPQQNFVILNQGKARFTVVRPLGADRATTYACELADLDGDGDLDIATGNDMAPGHIFLNDGTGNFKSHTEYGEVTSVRSLTAADVDSDGDIDILVTCRGRQNRIYLNDGLANFSDSLSFGQADDSTIDVAIADINRDGHQDLVLANRDGQPNCLLLNNGKLEFSDRKPFGTGKDETRAIAVADFNGDGNLDWATGNIGQPNGVFFGDGLGGVLKSIEIGQPDSRTYTLQVADLDQDGKMDIVAGNSQQPNAVFFNRDNGNSFQETSFGSDSAATYGLSLGDLDGDGFDDIAVANSDALNHVYLNRAKRESTQRRPSEPRPAKESTKVSTPPMAATNNAVAANDETTNWDSFRGNGGRGVADGFPIRTHWNADNDQKLDGVLWQTEVPGLGHSSPVVFGDKLFLVTAVSSEGNSPLKIESGGKPTAADDNGEQSWMVLCYHKTTGQELWRRTAQKGKPRATRHAKATHANTSVCVDGKHVLVFLGSEGLHCFDMDGESLWSKDLGVINISKYGIGWGFASSPAIHGDRIAIVCDDPTNPFVAALKLSDGEEVWRVSRKGICERSWASPLIHAGPDTTQVVVNGWPWILSYDLKTGKELWRVKGGGDNPIPTPFEANGWFYITNSHGGQSPILVIRPEARGELTTAAATASPESKSAIVWSAQRGGSYMSTPVVYGDYLYLGNSNGVVRCFHAKTGQPMYEKRLDSGAGIIASLVAADNKIFCASENGQVYVLEPGPEFNVLATNSLGSPCLATPAISAGVLYIRTTDRLIAIQ